MNNTILDYIPIGRENAINAQTLAALCGISSPRKLQSHIHELRRDTVILSTSGNPSGYYLPRCDDDVRDFIRTLEARGRNTLAALKSARIYLKKDLNQATLNIFED